MQKQITKAKAVTKPATKVAAKPAAKRTVRKAPQKPVDQVKFVITTRPSAGARLAGYTAAWMKLSGFINGAPMSRNRMVAIAGETAVAYHTRQGNFERTEAGMILTEQGKAHFAIRGDQAPDYRAGFEVLMTTGKLDPRTDVVNPTIVKAI